MRQCGPVTLKDPREVCFVKVVVTSPRTGSGGIGEASKALGSEPPKRSMWFRYLQAHYSYAIKELPFFAR
ncbi:hypothetical protein ACN42_g10918 [Penicillium freii]|uniref:Uncharacterized protein n=1 Tax=Penicillium freii TaxID=48697 RepID=A0A117NKL3_PENFR|nr:hypothetical protein ACN42_g10918 [Penicillium freii]